MANYPAETPTTTHVEAHPHPALAPAASPRARWWTILCGVLLLAASGVALHDLLVLRDTVEGRLWLDPVFDGVANATYGSWVLPSALGCGILALVFFIATVLPRAHTHLGFAGDSSLHARPVDIARICTATARRVGGVFRASTVVTRKRIVVTVNTAAGENTEAEIVSAHVQEKVSDIAQMLASPPKVIVKIAPVSTGGDRG